MISVGSSGAFVTPQGWVQMDQWAGRSLRRLPLAIREPDEPLTHCDSIVAAVSDPACDPRSGGIAGAAHLAARCGVGPQQFRTNLLPTLDFVRWLADIPVSNVGSVDAWAENYRAGVRRKWKRNLGMGEE